MKTARQISRARHWFLKTALAYLGTPYVWAGDDPSGFDCSGFVLECLKTAGLVDDGIDMTSDALWNRFCAQTATSPHAGALLFTFDRNNGRARHVAICLDSDFQIGASGGDARVGTASRAWERNAWVRIRPIVGFQGKKIADPFMTING